MSEVVTVAPLVGLLPAAGSARRISPLPCSKEILPVGYDTAMDRPQGHCRVAIHLILEQMRAAGGRQAFIVLNPRKMDVPAYLADGSAVDVDLAYLVTQEPWGVPFTLDRAFAYLKQATVLFGFPDILIDQPGAYEALLGRLDDGGEDMVLGVFPANKPAQEDLVALDAGGKVQHLEIKNHHSQLELAWMQAVWRPAFSRFLHKWTERWRGVAALKGPSAAEPYLGDVINDAIAAGVKVGAVPFDQGDYLDIGTPANLAKAPQFAAGISARAI